MPFSPVMPILDYSVRNLCPKRYHGHPKGCPNYAKRPSCPPAAPILPDVLDLSQTVFCVWNAFDFGAHVERMRTRHPEWSERQLACCLYWQSTARKQLKEAIRHTLGLLPLGAIKIVSCPEACGVDVTATMKQLSVYLQWPPKTIAYQVALIGTPKG